MKCRSKKIRSNSALVICTIVTGALLIFFLFTELANADTAAATKGNECAAAAAPEADQIKPEDEVKAKPQAEDEAPTVKMSKAAEQRWTDVHTIRMRTAPTRALIAQIFAPASKNKPILILMPGNVRALNSADGAIKALIEKGFGVASMDFSQLPFSIANTKKDVSNPFAEPRPTLDDLISEVDQFIEYVREEFPDNKTIIPVSLSYSGIVSPHLKGYELIIDTVPMTSTDAANPFGSSATKLMGAMGLFWFPFGGMQTQIDNATRTTISYGMRSGFVGELAKDFPDRFKDMVEGSLNLHKIADGLEWNIDAQLVDQTRRVFMIAENESSSLQRHQLQTFKSLSALRKDTLLIYVKGAGHVIPMEAPNAYALAVQLALSPKYRHGGVISVEEKSPKETVLSAEEIQKLLGPQ